MCTKTDAFLSQYKHLFPLTIEIDGSENSLLFCPSTYNRCFHSYQLFTKTAAYRNRRFWSHKHIVDDRRAGLLSVFHAWLILLFVYKVPVYIITTALAVNFISRS